MIIFLSLNGLGQPNPIYKTLPVSKYAVGFKIITITDDTRVTRPLYNYLGEKNNGDNRRKITIHLWYPAMNHSGKRKLRFEDYCYNNLLTSTAEITRVVEKNAQINRIRASVERWFGKTTVKAWQNLLANFMLAEEEAVPLRQHFPLLIGMLRPLSTSITNELMASNGYVVAMISNAPFTSFSNAALSQVPDMQFAINYLKKSDLIDATNIGVFGFSGSGFIPVLFSMFDQRVKALADIESGIYMEELHQALSASDFYTPSKLRIPFLHIFSRDLSKQEKHLDELEQKTKFARRHRLLLNQPALHHWDFATEGYVSAAVLNMRGEQQYNIKKSFEIAAHYLLQFFNAELKSDEAAQKFLVVKPVLPTIDSTLWDIITLQALKPPPDNDEFDYLIRTKGIDSALTIVKNTLPNDSSTNLMQGFVLNNLGYTFLQEKKYREAIGVFKLNTELHPADANFFDSLAESYEASGDKENMQKASAAVIDIIGKKNPLSDADKMVKELAEKRMKN